MQKKDKMKWDEIVVVSILTIIATLSYYVGFIKPSIN